MKMRFLSTEEGDDYTACRHACEECEERNCRNQWLEIPDGRRLQIAEYFYTQNICILLLVFLLTIFSTAYRKLKKLANMYELVHVEELAYDADRPEIPQRWDLTNRLSISDDNDVDIYQMEKNEDVEQLVELNQAEIKILHDNAIPAHESLYRAFAFCETVKGQEMNSLTPAHETLLEVINKIPGRHYYQALLTSVSGELMGLGWIAIFVWVGEHAGFFQAASVGRNGRWGPQRADEAKIAFENVHFVVFAGVVLYFLFVLWAFRSALKRIDGIMKQELELAKSRCAGDEDDTILNMEHDIMNSTMFGKMNLDRALFPGYRKALLNWIENNMSKFDEYQILSPKFSMTLFSAIKDEFPVAIYIRLSLDNIVEEFVDVRISSWLLIFFIFGIEALITRLGEFDIPIVTLGSAAILNLLIFLMLLYSHYEINKIRNGTAQQHPAVPTTQWIQTQFPHFIQAATLYTTIQFARFVVDSIIDIKLQKRHYRGNKSYIAVLAIQLINLAFHFFLHAHIFPRLCILIASPPVISCQSIDLLAEITTLYAGITRKIQRHNSSFMKNNKEHSSSS